MNTIWARLDDVVTGSFGNSDACLFKELEKRTGSVVVDAVLKVEELLNALFLVFQLFVTRLLLSSSNTLNTLLEVVLEVVADTLSSSFSDLGVRVFRLIVIFIFIFLLFFVIGTSLLSFFFFFRLFFFNIFLQYIMLE